MMVYDRLEKELWELGVSIPTPLRNIQDRCGLRAKASGPKELLIKFVSCSLSPLSFHTCSQ